MTKKVIYDLLNSALHRMNAQLSASETHGLIAGMSSLYLPENSNAWQNILLAELECSDISAQDWDVFSSLREQVLMELGSEEYEFELLLPDDEDSLEERLEAIALWCRGYLTGLALAGLSTTELNNQLVQEVVEDLSQIANMSIETENKQEAEFDYMQLVEYVKVAAHNINLELQEKELSQAVH